MDDGREMFDDDPNEVPTGRKSSCCCAFKELILRDYNIFLQIVKNDRFLFYSQCFSKVSFICIQTSPFENQYVCLNCIIYITLVLDL